MPKRPSSGLTAKIDARLIEAMENKAKAHKKATGGRAVVGYLFLGISALFMVAEFFHLVPHEQSVGHWILQGAPLVIGLALVAPDVIDKVKDLLMGLAGLVGKLRGLRLSIKEEDKEE